MPFFRKKPPIRPEEYEWLLACFAWLRAVLEDGDIRPELITIDHPALQSAETGAEMFAAIRKLAGMDNWPCRLEKVETTENAPELGLIEGSSACGTFSIENGEAVIRYSSSMLRNREALAATFAHELCHFLLANAGDPPGGPELMEHSTDCAATYLGFGVLLSNTARQFEQWSDGGMQGWRSSTSGYLSEQSLVTGTALFAALHGYETAGAETALKPYLRKDFIKAKKAIAQDFPSVGKALSQVDLTEWNFG